MEQVRIGEIYINVFIEHLSCTVIDVDKKDIVFVDNTERVKKEHQKVFLEEWFLVDTARILN
jgi:hypothetical protein